MRKNAERKAALRLMRVIIEVLRKKERLNRTAKRDD